MFNSILLIIIGTLFTSTGQILLKKSSSTLTRSMIINIKNIPLMIGIFVYFISMVFTIYALKMGELSVLSPITALSYIWTVLLSLIIFKEHINKYKWCGLLLIIIGIITITTV